MRISSGFAHLSNSARPLTTTARCSLGRKLYSQVPLANDQPIDQQTESPKGVAKETGQWAARDFFLSVLSATTTKRDAKSYLSRFRPGDEKALNVGATANPIHVSLIKVRATDAIDDQTLDGLARTFSQLNRLGLSCVIVVDTDAHVERDKQTKADRDLAAAQADRVVSAFYRVAKTKARRVDGVLGLKPLSAASNGSAVSGIADVEYSNILRSTLARGLIAIVPTLAYDMETHQKSLISADEVLLALTRFFAGLPTCTGPDVRAGQAPNAVLERIVLLDPIGGIPSATRSDHAHIFVNLEQEYDEIMLELKATAENSLTKTDVSIHRRHKRNLETLNKALKLLPPSSSALLTTPTAAATPPAASKTTVSPSGLGVQTRRPKNPLIFNLLTDKSIVSSSLPTKRLSKTSDGEKTATTQVAPATFIKRGMPVSMVPDPHQQKWEPPQRGEQLFNLDDPRIDFPRLLNLIEDSFNRPLDVEDYVKRIRNKTAGIIIAGEYEGGAILTWELPPGVPDDGSESSRQRMVPYLDKFAVLKRSQGAGGVADIVFSCMVRSCFPQGVCWRSRKDNPVNKWYFERAVGTQKIADSNWTMFWTTEGLMQDEQRWKDYEAVCRSIQPSWADKKHIVD